ncbi:hypothetical protein [Algoriphagus persicinus]|uniref:hypothetical protein n=1 Tax=Algoriphagus persicinus TaxID=3108754 RepID=UPI002B3A0A64|nr:hypothetical protein [Algoriphagus sp. E1-3-M2]MEB2783798.1 hypothetical protein [Algoriphagus sp. E1-3-M2]
MKIILIFYAILFFCFVLFSPSYVVGQESNFLFSGEKHLVGINGSLTHQFLFDRPKGLPLEVVYRKFNSKNQALRFRLEGSYSKLIDDDGIYYEKKWDSSFGGAMGYEWHKPVSQRWSWYYGGELAGTYYWLDDDYARPTVFTGIPMIVYRYRTDRVVEKSVQGFFGFLFNLNSKIFLSFQQDLRFSHMNYSSTGTGELDPIDQEIEDIYGANGGGDEKFVYIRVFIISKIGVHFKF